MNPAVSSRRERKLSTWRRGLVALVAAVFVLAACSSNSTVTVADDADQDGEAAAATPTEAPAATTDAAPEDTADADDEQDGEPADDERDDAPPAADDSADDEPEDALPADEDSSDGDDDDPSFAGADSGDFCRIARELDENDPFEDPELQIFSEEFFEVVLDFYTRVERIAPDEIRPDFVTIRGGFEQFAAVAEAADYNLFDPSFAEAAEAIGTAEFDQAAENIEAYLLQVCDVDIGGIDDMSGSSAPADPSAPGAAPVIPDAMLDALGGVDLENLTDADIAALSQVLFSQLAADPELQACLFENIDRLLAVSEDPNVLNQEICGTTLLNIFAGLGG